MKAVILGALLKLTSATQLYQTDFTATELENNPNTFHELLKQWDVEVEDMEKNTYDLWQDEEVDDKENAVDMINYLGFAKYMNFTTYDAYAVEEE